MKSEILKNLKRCPLEDLEKEIKKIDLSKLDFFELADLRGGFYNELYFQLKPISDEMERKYLEMKRQEKENLKQAS